MAFSTKCIFEKITNTLSCVVLIVEEVSSIVVHLTALLLPQLLSVMFILFFLVTKLKRARDQREPVTKERLLPNCQTNQVIRNRVLLKF